MEPAQDDAKGYGMKKRESSARLRDDRTALILWCWVDGQQLSAICRATDRCMSSVNVQIAEFIKKRTGQNVYGIYGEARKELGRRALEEYRKTEHRIHA